MQSYKLVDLLPQVSFWWFLDRYKACEVLWFHLGSWCGLWWDFQSHGETYYGLHSTSCYPLSSIGYSSVGHKESILHVTLSETVYYFECLLMFVASTSLCTDSVATLSLVQSFCFTPTVSWICWSQVWYFSAGALTLFICCSMWMISFWLLQVTLSSTTPSLPCSSNSSWKTLVLCTAFWEFQSSDTLLVCSCPSNKYNVDILKGASMIDCKMCSTLVDTHTKVSAMDGAPVGDPTLSQSCRALQYFSFTRLDIAYAVQQVCLHMHDPPEPHLSAVKRIFCYLQGTLHYRLHLRPCPPSNMVVYTDVDWADV